MCHLRTPCRAGRRGWPARSGANPVQPSGGIPQGLRPEVRRRRQQPTRSSSLLPPPSRATPLPEEPREASAPTPPARWLGREAQPIAARPLRAPLSGQKGAGPGGRERARCRRAHGGGGLSAPGMRQPAGDLGAGLPASLRVAGSVERSWGGQRVPGRLLRGVADCCPDPLLSG